MAAVKLAMVSSLVFWSVAFEDCSDHDDDVSLLQIQRNRADAKVIAIPPKLAEVALSVGIDVAQDLLWAGGAQIPGIHHVPVVGDLVGFGTQDMANDVMYEQLSGQIQEGFKKQAESLKEIKEQIGGLSEDLKSISSDIAQLGAEVQEGIDQLSNQMTQSTDKIISEVAKYADRTFSAMKQYHAVALRNHQVVMSTIRSNDLESHHRQCMVYSTNIHAKYDLFMLMQESLHDARVRVLKSAPTKKDLIDMTVHEAKRMYEMLSGVGSDISVDFQQFLSCVTSSGLQTPSLLQKYIQLSGHGGFVRGRSAMNTLALIFDFVDTARMTFRMQTLRLAVVEELEPQYIFKYMNETVSAGYADAYSMFRTQIHQGQNFFCRDGEHLDTPALLDRIAPTSIVIDHSEQLPPQPSCTNCSYATDSNAGRLVTCARFNEAGGGNCVTESLTECANDASCTEVVIWTTPSRYRRSGDSWNEHRISYALHDKPVCGGCGRHDLMNAFVFTEPYVHPPIDVGPETAPIGLCKPENTFAASLLHYHGTYLYMSDEAFKTVDDCASRAKQEPGCQGDKMGVSSSGSQCYCWTQVYGVLTDHNTANWVSCIID